MKSFYEIHGFAKTEIFSARSGWKQMGRIWPERYGRAYAIAEEYCEKWNAL